jgi:hypothetical protein
LGLRSVSNAACCRAGFSTSRRRSFKRILRLNGGEQSREPTEPARSCYSNELQSARRPASAPAVGAKTSE